MQAESQLVCGCGSVTVRSQGCPLPMSDDNMTFSADTSLLVEWKPECWAVVRPLDVDAKPFGGSCHVSSVSVACVMLLVFTAVSSVW